MFVSSHRLLIYFLLRVITFLFVLVVICSSFCSSFLSLIFLHLDFLCLSHSSIPPFFSSFIFFLFPSDFLSPVNLFILYISFFYNFLSYFPFTQVDFSLHINLFYVPFVAVLFSSVFYLHFTFPPLFSVPLSPPPPLSPPHFLSLHCNSKISLAPSLLRGNRQGRCAPCLHH